MDLLKNTPYPEPLRVVYTQQDLVSSTLLYHDTMPGDERLHVLFAMDNGDFIFDHILLDETRSQISIEANIIQYV